MGRATLTARLKRLEFAAPVPICSLCRNKPVVHIEPMLPWDAPYVRPPRPPPCPECGRPKIHVVHVPMDLLGREV